MTIFIKQKHLYIIGKKFDLDIRYSIINVIYIQQK